VSSKETVLPQTFYNVSFLQDSFYSVFTVLVYFYFRWSGENKKRCDSAHMEMKLPNQRKVDASSFPFILLLPQVSNAET